MIRDFWWCWVYSLRELWSRRVSFFKFVLILYPVYFIAIAIPPKPMATPLRTNLTSNATTLAIPTVPTAITPHSAIVSTMDKVRSILSYFLYDLSRWFLSMEIYFCISLICCNLNALTHSTEGAVQLLPVVLFSLFFLVQFCPFLSVLSVFIRILNWASNVYSTYFVNSLLRQGITNTNELKAVWQSFDSTYGIVVKRVFSTLSLTLTFIIMCLYTGECSAKLQYDKASLLRLKTTLSNSEQTTKLYF